MQESGFTENSSLDARLNYLGQQRATPLLFSILNSPQVVHHSGKLWRLTAWIFVNWAMATAPRPHHAAASWVRVASSERDRGRKVILAAGGDFGLQRSAFLPPFFPPSPFLLFSFLLSFHFILFLLLFHYFSFVVIFLLVNFVLVRVTCTHLPGESIQRWNLPFPYQPWGTFHLLSVQKRGKFCTTRILLDI